MPFPLVFDGFPFRLFFAWAHRGRFYDEGASRLESKEVPREVEIDGSVGSLL